MMDKALEFALEEKDDIYFRELMSRVMEEKRDELLSGRGVPGDDEGMPFESFLVLARKERKRAGRKRFFKKAGSTLQKTAACLFLISAAGLYAATSVEASRGAIIKWLISWNEKNVSIMPDIDSEAKSAIPDPVELSYKLNWLPDDCTWTAVYTPSFSVDYTLYKNNEKIGEVDFIDLRTAITIDTEGAIVERPFLDGYSDGMYIEKQYDSEQYPVRHLIARNQYCIVHIRSERDCVNGLSKDEIYKIFENIEYFG